MKFGATTWRWLVPVTALVTAACVDPRTRPDDSCPTWKGDLGPKVAAACASAGCHAATSPAGGYNLTTYLGALGPGSDTTANAIAGDASSAILTMIDPATATGPHAGLGALHAALTPWVTTCKVAYFDSPLHPGGILDPHSDEFHGKELERRTWNFELCARCHGADFRGTTVVPACTTCHTRGPTACDTCHPAQPTSNAHTTHIAKGFPCTTCHVVPLVWNQEGHILRGGTADPPPAEVTITGLATTTIDPADRTGPPTYDPTTHQCSQVYCHGQVLGPTGATNPTPTWTNDPPGPPPCSSCHGAPPTSHARSRCAECHPGGDKHLDGMVEIGTGLPGCAGCHGSSDTSPAPPRDLDGNTQTTAIGVGAHQAHLLQPHHLTAPLPCTTCHLVPATVTAPGHLDSASPAEVVPALGWDRNSQTCATAFCHGPSRPVWTSSQGVFCGSCHGAPPATPAHATATTLASCTTCHPRTIDVFGNIKITDGPNGPVSTHINGVVDAP